jgi:hypothetical protein
MDMASERQIAANRANAKRSTGPKTAAGKLRSSRNAFRHGLSGPLPSDPATSAKVDRIAGEFAGDQAGEHRKAAAQDVARAQMELLRIRSIRSEHLAKIEINGGLGGNMRELKRLASLDRYERYALTKRRRSSRGLRSEG